MEKNNKYLLLGLIIIVLIILFTSNPLSYLNVNTYKPYRYNYDSNDPLNRDCKTYYEECKCYGEFNIGERDPPFYSCRGFEFCDDIDIVECE